MSWMTDRPRGAPWWVGLTIVVAALAALVCLLVLWAYVPPERNYLYFGIAQGAVLAVAAVWLLLGLVGWAKYRTLRLTAIAPVFALVTAVLVSLSIPSAFAFAVSEGALTATAEECPDVDTAERRVGLYRVWHTMPVDPDAAGHGGCVLYVRGGGRVDGVGLAYLPLGIPNTYTHYAGRPDIEYSHYDGDWYQFTQVF
ncbi:hypothetical protein CH293_07495 [Rhodococcus sp. 14-2470-1b]|nr:hypothetical protein CH293_07495 [Rhodococcus sp. 14-2470-1b]